ncbi:MAG: hypothetical protein ACI9Y1_000345 [Lentisphaeria bacterium]|jgi:hypothetical protein
MPHILPDIHTPVQHRSRLLSDPTAYQPNTCRNCGSRKLWVHGSYARKAACERGDGNPAVIPRFLCPNCKTTCSVLPEYIPPKRWYHWATQQLALWLLLYGNSYTETLDVLSRCGSGRNWAEPSGPTLQRWWSRFKDDDWISRFTVCSVLPSLGKTEEIKKFWLGCLDKLRLSSAMRLLFHEAGVLKC